MASSLFKIGKPILNYCAEIAQHVLPGVCLLCGARAERSNLCTPCRADLPHLPPGRCPRCAAPGTADALCGACLRRPPLSDRVIAACAYTYPLDRMIRSFKYAGNLAVGRLLADLIVAEARSEPLPDLIVPMPLSRERLRERGFNQALEIARMVVAELGVPLASEACIRVRHAPPQSGLDWDARAKNIAGAFACAQDMAGLSVAVVDDVVTTGATLNEIARVLRACGAARVAGWIAARTPEPS